MTNMSDTYMSQEHLAGTQLGLADVKDISLDRDDPLYLLETALSRLRTLWMRTTYPFAYLGKNVAVHHSVDLRRAKARHIQLGDGVYLGRDVWVNITLSPEGSGIALSLGDRCCIGRRSMISAKNRIVLEKDVTTGPNVLIMDHNHSYEDVTKPVEQQGVTAGGSVCIGEGSFLGFGCAVVCASGELSLGRHCFVATNSVVTRSFPPYCVLAGNPARIVRQFDVEKGAWVLGAAH